MHGTVTRVSASMLVDREAIRVGETLIDPARRVVAGPGGTAKVEPRVMQVLLALVDARGEVVTRERLLHDCWNGGLVGDDSLNRAIAEIRRLGRSVATRDFAVETVPRTGYRLVSEEDDPAPTVAADAPAEASGARALWARRDVLAAVGAVVVASTGYAVLSGQAERRRRATQLSDQALSVLHQQQNGAQDHAIALLEEAGALDPADPRITGRLALAWAETVESASPDAVADAVARCTRVAHEALALDPEQPDARAALALIAPTYGDWLNIERQLRAVLADDPLNIAATGALSVLLMSVGRSRDGIALNAAFARREPFLPMFQYRRVYHHWIEGRLGDMDRVADRALQLWPRHAAVWFARLWTLAFTQRATAALALIDDPANRPPVPKPYLDSLRRAVAALAGDGATRRDATEEQLSIATRSPSAAINAVLLLAGLGAAAEALSVAEGYLLHKGPHIVALRPPSGQPTANDQRYRKTIMLFVPVTAALRSEPRFDALCRDAGLEDYWRRSGTVPDYRRTA